MCVCALSCIWNLELLCAEMFQGFQEPLRAELVGASVCVCVCVCVLTKSHNSQIFICSSPQESLLDQDHHVAVALGPPHTDRGSPPASPSPSPPPPAPAPTAPASPGPQSAEAGKRVDLRGRRSLKKKKIKTIKTIKLQ